MISHLLNREGFTHKKKEQKTTKVKLVSSVTSVWRFSTSSLKEQFSLFSGGSLKLQVPQMKAAPLSVSLLPTQAFIILMQSLPHISSSTVHEFTHIYYIMPHESWCSEKLTKSFRYTLFSKLYQILLKLIKIQ